MRVLNASGLQALGGRMCLVLLLPSLLLPSLLLPRRRSSVLPAARLLQRVLQQLVVYLQAGRERRTRRGRVSP